MHVYFAHLAILYKMSEIIVTENSEKNNKNVKLRHKDNEFLGGQCEVLGGL